MGQKVPKEGEGIVSENGRRTGLAGHPRSFETCTSISVSLSCCVPLTWGGGGRGGLALCHLDPLCPEKVVVQKTWQVPHLCLLD